MTPGSKGSYDFALARSGLAGPIGGSDPSLGTNDFNIEAQTFDLFAARRYNTITT